MSCSLFLLMDNWPVTSMNFENSEKDKIDFKMLQMLYQSTSLGTDFHHL